MPSYTATRGINCRRYFATSVTADSEAEALAKARELMDPEHAGKWFPDFERSNNAQSMGHIDDLLMPTEGADESLSIVDDDGEVKIDFTDIPNADEPASFADLLAFARRVARFTTPEDEFAENQEGYATADDMAADFDGDRLFGEYQAFMAMVREARTLLKFPKEG